MFSFYLVIEFEKVKPISPLLRKEKVILIFCWFWVLDYWSLNTVRGGFWIVLEIYISWDKNGVPGTVNVREIYVSDIDRL